MTRQEESVQKLRGALMNNAKRAIGVLTITELEADQLIGLVKTRIIEKPKPVEQFDLIELASKTVESYSRLTGYNPAKLYASQQTLDELKAEAQPLLVPLHRAFAAPRPLSVFTPPTIFGIPLCVDNRLARGQFVAVP